MNYFELFGLPQAPSVNRSLLAAKYFDLQKKNHPDFFTQATETEKEEALEQSAAINKAFNIFQDKEKTIEYFLQLTGMIEADEKYSLPPAFLMEMMEINEALTEDGEKAVVNRINDYENALFEENRTVIENYDPANTGEQQLLKLKEYYYKKKYLKRILDRLGD